MALLSRCTLGFILLLGLLAPARAADAVDSALVVAYVNGEPITTRSLEREIIRIHNVQSHDTSRSGFDVDRLVQKLITDKLLAQEGRALGIHEDSLIAARVAKHRDQLALKVMLKESLPDTFIVSADELAAEYYAQYRRYEIRMLSVKDSLTAEAMRDSLRRGVPMERLAANHSVDKFKTKGGLAGIYKTIDMPEIVRDTLMNGSPGDLLGPLPLWRVWCLLRVEQQLPPDTTVSLDSARVTLEEQIKERRRKEAAGMFYAHLHADGGVAVDTAMVDSVLIRMSLGQPGTSAVLATIAGGRTLTDNELRNKYIHKTIGRVDREARPLLYGVLHEMLEALLLQEAASRSEYRRHPKIEEPVRAYEDSLVVLKYLEDVVSSKLDVPATEIEEFYKANPERFHERARYKIATLSRDLPEEAEADFQKLQAGTDFAWLVRQVSVDEAKDKGGDWDWISADKIPGGAATVDTLEIGEVSHAVESDHGYTLVKLVEIEKGPLMPLERVSDHIRSHLAQVKALEAIDETVKLLRSSADIDIREDVIQDLQITGRKG